MLANFYSDKMTKFLLGLKRCFLALFCAVVITEGRECKFTASGKDYNGTMSTTWEGKTCQRWDTQTPHEHSKLRAYTIENYCRNPDGSNSLWCYTTDPKVRWQYCPVPFCSGHQECKHDSRGYSYNGTINITLWGIPCQRWDTQQPHTHDDLEGVHENFCRHAGLAHAESPWCYTANPSVRWQYCPVPLCSVITDARECKFLVSGEDYKGTMSVTRSGRTCQRWDAQTPHSHNIQSNAFTVENYCRNAYGRTSPWCFTTDPSVIWDYCPVPFCSGCTKVCQTSSATASCRELNYLNPEQVTIYARVNDTFVSVNSTKKVQKIDSEYARSMIHCLNRCRKNRCCSVVAFSERNDMCITFRD